MSLKLLRAGPLLENDRLDAMKSERRMVVVPGAGHLFEEPGTLDIAVGHASAWFLTHLDQRNHR